MNKILNFTRVPLALVISFFTPVIAFGAALANPSNGITAPDNVLSSQSDVNATLCHVVNWMFYILIVFAVIMVLVAAYGYLTSNGDPDKASAAGKKLLYAAIAIIVALIASGFPNLVGSFFGQGSILPSC